MPRLQGSSHIVLTVTDVVRSAEWYQRVFVADIVADEKTNPAATSRRVRYRALFNIDTMTNVVGLLEHSDGDRSHFDERRVGLDHFALHVLERSDLDEWVSHLDQLGIPHSGIKSVDYADVITFREPDHIQLEICWHPNSGLVVSPVLSPIHTEPPGCGHQQKAVPGEWRLFAVASQ
jgi:glyoxylase I family protein